MYGRIRSGVDVRWLIAEPALIHIPSAGPVPSATPLQCPCSVLPVARDGAISPRGAWWPQRAASDARSIEYGRL